MIFGFRIYIQKNITSKLLNKAGHPENVILGKFPMFITFRIQYTFIRANIIRLLLKKNLKIQDIYYIFYVFFPMLVVGVLLIDN